MGVKYVRPGNLSPASKKRVVAAENKVKQRQKLEGLEKKNRSKTSRLGR